MKIPFPPFGGANKIKYMDVKLKTEGRNRFRFTLEALRQAD